MGKKLKNMTDTNLLLTITIVVFLQCISELSCSREKAF